MIDYHTAIMNQIAPDADSFVVEAFLDNHRFDLMGFSVTELKESFAQFASTINEKTEYSVVATDEEGKEFTTQWFASKEDAEKVMIEVERDDKYTSSEIIKQVITKKTDPENDENKAPSYSLKPIKEEAEENPFADVEIPIKPSIKSILESVEDKSAAAKDVVNKAISGADAEVIVQDVVERVSPDEVLSIFGILEGIMDSRDCGILKSRLFDSYLQKTFNPSEPNEYAARDLLSDMANPITEEAFRTFNRNKPIKLSGVMINCSAYKLGKDTAGSLTESSNPYPENTVGHYIWKMGVSHG